MTSQTHCKDQNFVKAIVFGISDINWTYLSVCPTTWSEVTPKNGYTYVN